MKIEFVKGDNFKEYVDSLNRMDIDTESYNINMFKGFAYFSPIDLNSDGSNFLVAVDENINQIVGVLKIKRYALSNHKYVSEEEIINKFFTNKTYIGVRYLDVRVDYKRKGIATELIKNICNIINQEANIKTEIKLSFLTQEGSIAKLNQIFKKYAKNIKISIVR